MNSDAPKAHHPGEIVSESGIYECDCARHHAYSTDVKGHRFPPLPDACTGNGWPLKAAAHPES
ncbi:hypothetical protein E5082_32175 [Streptomyces griseoluteus]|uniref:Uncharacterized protein n=1 Tax=Streptomyces griseoluteus TaxID=29306 RepID=A0A4Z1CWW3_STRGP|nr:hypothetical protein E5082_32175 [Streptomyces griseoluteus]